MINWWLRIDLPISISNKETCTVSILQWIHGWICWFNHKKRFDAGLILMNKIKISSNQNFQFSVIKKLYFKTSIFVLI